MLLDQSDRVEKNLIVNAPGVSKSTTITKLVCPKSGQDRKETIIFEDPDDIVKGSESLSVSVIGDILGPSVKHTSRMLETPSGNGDVSSMTLWSNLLIFDYTQRFGNSLGDDVHRRLLGNIKSAYKVHIDTYLNPYDGSFNEFYQEPYCCQKTIYKHQTLGREVGPDVCLMNEMSSSWITAATVRSLHRIEQMGIMSLDKQLWFALGWLAQPNKLLEDGCMKTSCYNCEAGLKHGKSRRSLSAYILATVIELTNCGENKRQIFYKDPLPQDCGDHECADSMCNPRQFAITDKEIAAFIRKAFDCFTPAKLAKDSYATIQVFRLISVYFANCRMPKHDNKVLRLLEHTMPMVFANTVQPYWSQKHVDDGSRIEMTGYVLLALNNFARAMKAETLRFTNDDLQTLIRRRAQLSKWLIEQRNSLGGWIGTADTMAALEAITDFAALEAVGQREECCNLKLNTK